MYEVIMSPQAEKSLARFYKSNPKAFRKVKDLVHELALHPRTGTGHPEPLKGFDGNTYSRQVTKKDRMVYDIIDKRVVVNVLSVEGHYKDK